MTFAWMTYATLVAVLLAIAAVAVERIAMHLGFARRFVWTAALVAAAVTPLRPAVSTGREPAYGSFRVPAATSDANTTRRNPRQSSRNLIAGLAAFTRQFDRYARNTAAATSLLVFVFFCRTALLLRARRRAWPAAKVDGHDVLIASDVGPGVVGWFRPTIVYPKWALDLRYEERELMFRHEAQHIHARDPLLVLLSGILLVCFPWNAALWWMVRRLRLAIEVDCDARVVREVGRPHEYGLLLLAVGERLSMPSPLAASLADDKPFLARRIDAMTALRPKHPLLVSLPFLSIALAATAAAAQTPVPSGAGVSVGGKIAGISERAAAGRDTIRALIQARYPQILKDGSPNLIYRVGFVMDASGNVLTSGLTVEPNSDDDSKVVVARAEKSSDALDLTKYGLSVYPRESVGRTASSSTRAGVLGPGHIYTYVLYLK